MSLILNKHGCPAEANMDISPDSSAVTRRLVGGQRGCFFGGVGWGKRKWLGLVGKLQPTSRHLHNS